MPSCRRQFIRSLILGLLALPAVHWLSPAATRAAGPTARQIAARPSAANVKIVVGANVQVSAEDVAHRESVVTADPTNASNLVIAAICNLPKSTRERIIVYQSSDGGKTWRTVLERRPGANGIMADPALAFGPDGTCYSVHMAYTDADAKTWATKLGTMLDVGGVPVFRSSDGGKTWKSVSTIRQFIDRPFLAVDHSNGKYRGRIYCTGNISAAKKALVLWTSDDQGTSFAKAQALTLKDNTEFQPGNPDVFSNGTLAAIYYLWTRNSDVRPEIHVLLSDNGGQSVQESGRVPTDWSDPNARSGFRVFFPQLAADTFSTLYRDRLYAVWEDGYPRVRIMFAFSPDKGQSWTGPTILSEQPTGGDRDYSAFMPSIAVNKDGVVAITWYDRRGLPDDPLMRYPPGCYIRMRTSIDGGATWQPSVQLNKQAIKASGEDLRDTAGIAADRSGSFHPVCDRRPYRKDASLDGDSQRGELRSSGRVTISIQHPTLR